VCGLDVIWKLLRVKMKALKTRAEIEAGLSISADKLKEVIQVDKLNQVKAQSEPFVPVGGNNNQPVSPPPSTIDTKR